MSSISWKGTSVAWSITGRTTRECGNVENLPSWFSSDTLSLSILNLWYACHITQLARRRARAYVTRAFTGALSPASLCWMFAFSARDIHAACSSFHSLWIIWVLSWAPLSVYSHCVLRDRRSTISTVWDRNQAFSIVCRLPKAPRTPQYPP